MLPNEITGFLNLRGHAIQVGTRSNNLKPEATRGFAFSVDSTGTKAWLIVGSKQSVQMLQNLRDNGDIAVSACYPWNYTTFQFKGKFTGSRESNAEEITLLNEHFSEFCRFILQYFGEESVKAVQSLDIMPVVTVEFEVSEIFDQTPGPDAGKKL